MHARYPEISSFISHHSSLQFKQRFTLIELLVVIAIIAILAGMLLPALSQARERAKSAECLNRVKQCTLAMGAYAADHKETYMFYVHSNYNPTSWDWSWVELLRKTNYLATKGSNKTYATDCPSSPVNSYAANYLPPTDDRIAGFVQNQLVGITTRRIKSASSYFLLADAAKLSSGAGKTCTVLYISGDSVNSHIHTRHNNRASISFLDGHVALNDRAKMTEAIYLMYAGRSTGTNRTNTCFLDSAFVKVKNNTPGSFKYF